jgi:hypothetical protein
MRKTAQWTRSTGRFCIACFNGVLITIAALQASIAMISYFNREIPVPRFVREKLQERLAGYGVTPRFKHLHFDLLGNVHARQVAIYRENSDELLAAFDTVMVDLDAPMLLVKRVVIDEIRFARGAAYCPAMYSSSGVDEPVVSNLNGGFRKIDDRWVAPRLVMRIHNLPISFNGDWSSLVRPPLSKLPLIRRSPVDRYLAFCQDLLARRGWMDMIEQPFLNIVTNLDQSGLPIARISGGSNSASFPGKLRLGQFRFRFSGPLPFDIDSAVPIEIALVSAHWEDHFEARDLNALVTPGPPGKFTYPITGSARVSAGSFQASGFALENLVVSLSHSAESRATGHGIGHFLGREFRFDLDLDSARFAGSIGFDSHLDVNQVLTALGGTWTSTDSASDLVFQTPPRIRATIALDAGMRFNHAEFSLRSGPVRLRHAEFDRLQAEGIFDPHRLDVSRLTVGKDDRVLSAGLRYDRATGDYRCLARGTLLPDDLQPAMRPWWHRLWAPFKFSHNPLEVDVDIQSNLRTREIQWFFGHLAADEIRFKEQLFTRLQMKSWIFSNFVELFDLQAERPEGGATGVLQWIFREGAPIARTFDLDTSIDIAGFAGFLGDDIGKVVGEITTTAPPRLKITGYLSALDSGWPHRRDLIIDAVATAPLTAFGYPLESLSFQSRLRDDLFAMRPLRFGLGGGEATGSLLLDTSRDPPQLEFDCTLKGAHQSRVFSILGWPDLLPKQPALAKRNGAKEEPSAPGRLDLDISGDGPVGTLSNFRASGMLRIMEADLGRIHLFGGLSKLLYGTGLGFASITLDTAEGPFVLENGDLHFPHLEISGPNSVIRANGLIKVLSRDLDFRVRVNYLDTPQNPLMSIIGPIFNSLGNAFELHLRGTTEEPNWKLAFDPRRVLGTSASADGAGGDSTADPYAAPEKNLTTESNSNAAATDRPNP